MASCVTSHVNVLHCDISGLVSNTSHGRYTLAHHDSAVLLKDFSHFCLPSSYVCLHLMHAVPSLMTLEASYDAIKDDKAVMKFSVFCSKSDSLISLAN